MVRRIVLLGVVLVLAAGTLFAGPLPGGIARELALGGSTLSPIVGGPNIVLNPFIVNDPTIALLNPAYQGKYRDYAWMNLGGGTPLGTNAADNVYGKQFGGVNFSFGKELALGVNLSYDPSFANLVVGNLSSFINSLPEADRGGRGAQVGLPPVEVFEAVASTEIGSLDVGFAFLYGWARNTSTSSNSPSLASTDYKLSANVIGFRFGIAMDMGAGMGFDADAAIRFDNVTDNEDSKNTLGVATNLGDFSGSATEIQLDGRFHLKMSNRVNFVPYATFMNVSEEPKRDSPPTGITTQIGSAKRTYMLFALGAGMEYKVNSFYLAGGVSFKTASQKTEQSTIPPVSTSTSTNTELSFPQINLGMEFVFTEWLTGRMGYYRAFHSESYKSEFSAAGTSSTSESTLAHSNSNVVFGSLAGADNSLVTLGLGFTFGNFALDATVSEDALRRGLGLIGSQDNLNTFGYMTASYCFQ